METRSLAPLGLCVKEKMMRKGGVFMKAILAMLLAALLAVGGAAAEGVTDNGATRGVEPQDALQVQYIPPSQCSTDQGAVIPRNSPSLFSKVDIRAIASKGLGGMS